MTEAQAGCTSSQVGCGGGGLEPRGAAPPAGVGGEVGVSCPPNGPTPSLYDAYALGVGALSPSARTQGRLQTHWGIRGWPRVSGGGSEARNDSACDGCGPRPARPQQRLERRKYRKPAGQREPSAYAVTLWADCGGEATATSRMDECWRIVDAVEIRNGDDAYSINRRASRRSRRTKLGATGGTGHDQESRQQWHQVGSGAKGQGDTGPFAAASRAGAPAAAAAGNQVAKPNRPKVAFGLPKKRSAGKAKVTPVLQSAEAKLRRAAALGAGAPLPLGPGLVLHAQARLTVRFQLSAGSHPQLAEPVGQLRRVLELAVRNAAASGFSAEDGQAAGGGGGTRPAGWVRAVWQPRRRAAVAARAPAATVPVIAAAVRPTKYFLQLVFDSAAAAVSYLGQFGGGSGQLSLKLPAGSATASVEIAEGDSDEGFGWRPLDVLQKEWAAAAAAAAGGGPRTALALCGLPVRAFAGGADDALSSCEQAVRSALEAKFGPIQRICLRLPTAAARAAAADGAADAAADAAADGAGDGSATSVSALRASTSKVQTDTTAVDTAAVHVGPCPWDAMAAMASSVQPGLPSSNKAAAQSAGRGAAAAAAADGNARPSPASSAGVSSNFSRASDEEDEEEEDEEEEEEGEGKAPAESADHAADDEYLDASTASFGAFVQFEHSAAHTSCAEALCSRDR